MSLASVKLARRWVDLAFITPNPIDDVRIRGIELYGPTSFGHTVRLGHPDEIDSDVRGWLATALRRGDQETLNPRAHVEPLVGRSLAVLLVPLHSRVAVLDNERVVRVPRYVAEAFGVHRRVEARIDSVRYPARIESETAGDFLVFDHDVLAELGFGEGDISDVFVSAGL